MSDTNKIIYHLEQSLAEKEKQLEDANKRISALEFDLADMEFRRDELRQSLVAANDRLNDIRCSVCEERTFEKNPMTLQESIQATKDLLKRLQEETLNKGKANG
jgi:predicted  nucleic acid-binding Zn-ribbon protein